MSEQPARLQMRLANLAVKVADLASVAEIVGRLPGLELVAQHDLAPGAFLEVGAGDSVLNVFEHLLYESDDDGKPVPVGFVHASYFVNDLEVALADPGWAATLISGPREIAGGFGRRRIAFFQIVPGVRIELMEDLDAGG